MKSMKFLLVMLFLFVAAESMAEFAGRPLTDNVIGPTGYTLNRGEFTVGLGTIGFGFSDEVQASTNLLLFAFQLYNADLKVAFKETDDQAFSAGVGFSHIGLDVSVENEEGHYETEEDVGFTFIRPYAAVSHRLGENTLGHISGGYGIVNSDEDTDDADVVAVLQGTSFAAGIEQTYSERTKFMADVGYDTTFEGVRVGGAVLFGWTKFRLKLGLNYFGADDGFVFPIIGVWWRFEG